MQTNTKTDATMPKFQAFNVAIERSDALSACVTVLSANAVQEHMRSGSRTASATLSSFLLGMLRGNAKADEFDTFRDEGYTLAESKGLPVNRKSNSLAVLISRAKSVEASPLRDRAVAQAANLAQAVKFVAEAKKAKDAAIDAELAKELQEREESARVEAHKAAVQTGAYQATLLERVNAILSELADLGETYTLKKAKK